MAKYRDFLSAVTAGNLGDVKQICPNIGVLREMISADRYAAFILAAKNGHRDMVQFFIQRIHQTFLPDMLSAKDRESVTAFVYAAERGHFDIVQDLLKACTLEEQRVNMISEDEFAAIRYASARGYRNIVNYLVEEIHQPDLLLTMLLTSNNMGDDDDDIAIVNAAKNGHFDIVKDLLGPKIPAIFQQQMISYANHAAFRAAAEKGDFRLCKFILIRTIGNEERKKAIDSIDDQDLKQRITPLFENAKDIADVLFADSLLAPGVKAGVDYEAYEALTGLQALSLVSKRPEKRFEQDMKFGSDIFNNVLEFLTGGGPKKARQFFDILAPKNSHARLTQSTPTTNGSSSKGAVKKDMPAVPSKGAVQEELPAVPSKGAVQKDNPAGHSKGAVKKDMPAVPSKGAVQEELPAVPSKGDVQKDMPAGHSKGAVKKDMPAVPANIKHYNELYPGYSEMFQNQEALPKIVKKEEEARNTEWENSVSSGKKRTHTQQQGADKQPDQEPSPKTVKKEEARNTKWEDSVSGNKRTHTQQQER